MIKVNWNVADTEEKRKKKLYPSSNTKPQIHTYSIKPQTTMQQQQKR